jgi:hypothetical protein
LAANYPPYLSVQGYSNRTRGRFHPKNEQNVVKMRASSNWEMPPGRVRSKINAHDEIQDTTRSISDLLPVAMGRARETSTSDNVIYSFDRETTPGKPLALDMFVKTTGRETERFVEKEYEILDVNGEALRGRKARRNLRKATSESPIMGADRAADQAVGEDDDFELL